jgi:hypothetical protein
MEISWGFTRGERLFFIRRVSYIGEMFIFSFRPLARYGVEILYRFRNDVVLCVCNLISDASHSNTPHCLFSDAMGFV